MAKFVIIQPYVPGYRRELFDRLSVRLRSEGHELLVLSGEPRGSQRLRHDASQLQDAQHSVFASRVLRFGSIELRLGPPKQAWSDADVLVVELAAGSLTSYRALISPRPTAVWGHVGSYVAADHRLLRALRGWQVRKADRVLAYSDHGAATAVAYGARPDRVAVVHNTVDTAALRDAVLAARERNEPSVRRELGAPDGPLFAVIGGLDESKRIDLLVATLDRLWDSGSRIGMLIGGRGAFEHMLDAARARGQVVLLGHVHDQEKALMARVSTALFNPGRVGLIAVESFSLGLPVITTPHANHAPEFGYLRPGEDSLVVEADPGALAATLTRLVSNPEERARFVAATEARAGEFPLARMVDEMHAALTQLAGPARTGDRARTQE